MTTEEEQIIHKEYINSLTDEDLKLFYNEYQRRYKKKNKDKINSYQRDTYKKSVGITNKKDKKNHSNTMNGETENHSNTMKNQEDNLNIFN